jgi:hypothetical protein
VEAYKEAVRLLDVVLEQMESETDKMKLREIVICLRLIEAHYGAVRH